MALSILTLHFLRFNVTRILTPLTALFQRRHPLRRALIGVDNSQARTFGVLVATLRWYGSSGGLKGKKASGDAHPYLALFCWEKLFIFYNISAFFANTFQLKVVFCDYEIMFFTNEIYEFFEFLRLYGFGILTIDAVEMVMMWYKRFR